MPIQITEEDQGKIFVIRVSGKLTKQDYESFAPEFDQLVQQRGTLRLLFEMSGLTGWDAGAAWEDLKLGVRHYADIDRIAMVGETKWQKDMAALSRPFTKANVKYFDHSALSAARLWLQAS